MGRHLDAGGAILDTLAVLVFLYRGVDDVREIAAVRSASRRQVLVLTVSTVTLATLALVVTLPLAASSVMRTLDPFSGREQPLVGVLGTVSLLVLLWEVASELHLRASDTRVVIALLLYLAGGAVLGWLLATGVPSRRRTAIVLPTAMRDFAVAAGIATSAFGAAAAAPLGIYGILVLVFGTVSVYALRRR